MLENTINTKERNEIIMEKRSAFAEVGYHLLRVFHTLNSNLEKSAIDFAISIWGKYEDLCFLLLFIGFFIFELRLEMLDDPKGTKILQAIEGSLIICAFVSFSIYSAYSRGMLPK